MNYGILLGCICLVAAPLVIATPEKAETGKLASLGTIGWEEVVPGIEFGVIYGDWRNGPHAKLVRFQPGVTSPMHRHSGPYHAVVITGTVINPYAGEGGAPEMHPGDYWSTSAAAVHATGCVSEEPCLVYTHMDDLWDIEVVEAAGQ